jgi:hypothetical protein
VDPAAGEHIFKKSQQTVQIYEIVDIETAEKVLKDFEDLLVTYDGDLIVIGSLDVNDFLYKTRLRLWGIYEFRRKVNLQKDYFNRIVAMKAKRIVEPLNEDKLYEELVRVDTHALPKWKKEAQANQKD